MNVLAYVCDDLPETRTYRRRRFLWVPAAELGEPSGLLTVTLWHAKRLYVGGVPTAFERDTYQVEETDNVGHYPGRTFLVANTTGDRDAEEYGAICECRLPFRATDPSTCTCKAGECKVPAEPDRTLGCKHRDSLQKLIADGII